MLAYTEEAQGCRGYAADSVTYSFRKPEREPGRVSISHGISVAESLSRRLRRALGTILHRSQLCHEIVRLLATTRFT